MCTANCVIAKFFFYKNSILFFPFQWVSKITIEKSRSIISVQQRCFLNIVVFFYFSLSHVLTPVLLFFFFYFFRHNSQKKVRCQIYILKEIQKNGLRDHTESKSQPILTGPVSFDQYFLVEGTCGDKISLMLEVCF